MTAKELVSLNPSKVRNNEELMRLYLETFRGVFGKEPNCSGCTFSSDFNRLKRHLMRPDVTITTNTIDMKKHDFEVAPHFSKQILWYKDEKGQTHRSYGNAVTPEFVKGYLTHGSPAQIAARKRAFVALPTEDTKKAKSAVKTAENEPQKLTAAVLGEKLRPELDQIAKGMGLSPSDYTNKAKIINAILANG